MLAYENIEQEREQKKLGKKRRAETEKVLLTKISFLSWAGHVFRFGPVMPMIVWLVYKNEGTIY